MQKIKTQLLNNISVVGKGVATIVTTIAIMSNAHATDVSGYQIIEGVGISNAINIDMSRQEVINSQILHEGDNGNCHTADSCYFRLSPDTGSIAVTFTNNRVSEINISQRALSNEFRWPTASTGMIIDNKPRGEVAALYPGSVVYDNQVVVADLGYTYNYKFTCTSVCTTVSSHTIYRANGTQPGPEPTIEQEFVGDIVLHNPLRKAKRYTAVIVINNPDGSSSEVTQRVRIAGRGSISLDPSDFVDVEGTLGEYYYTATLYNKRGRVKGTDTGSFELVAK